MTTRIYVRASTKDQDAERALDDLITFSKEYGDQYHSYIENYSGTKLDRPALNRLLDEAEQGDILLVESVDRLSRLSQDDFSTLKQRIKAKGLRLVVADLPTTHTVNEGMTGDILNVINSMLIDLKIKEKKRGKLLLSHRYNLIPLLHSCPGGLRGSWS